MLPDLGIGIIGLGNAAVMHTVAIIGQEGMPPVEGAHIVGYFNHRGGDERFQQFRQRLGTEKGVELPSDITFTTELDEFLARDDINAVIIVTPSGEHASYGVRAAEAGKHMIMDKPLEVTLKAADYLTDACLTQGVVLAPVSQKRFEPSVQRTRQAIQDGKLGDLTEVHALVPWWRDPKYYKENWRGTLQYDGGGAAMNQGIHFIDLLRHLGGEVREIFGEARRIYHSIQTEDHAYASVGFENGATGTIFAATHLKSREGYKEQVIVKGTEGEIILAGGNLKQEVWQLRDNAPYTDPQYESVSSASDPNIIPLMAHRTQIQNIVRHIQGSNKLAVSPDDATRTLELILALYQSCELGRPVTLPIDRTYRPGPGYVRDLRVHGGDKKCQQT
ncbi:MAG TPA: Gfo/Idh/MocA family oxidoreductase [Candidatus Nanoarchaeia archaeon]|nr:Gfo/Idh/MocA family oxidoreductase [Candidatus Nanoarchaeia archaeon]